MNNKEYLFETIGDIDDDLIDDAATPRPKRKRQPWVAAVAACAAVAVLLFFTGTIVSFATGSNVFYEAGQFLKEALQKRTDSNDENILATYDGTLITKDIVQYNRKMNILRGNEAAEEQKTDLDIINKIIENLIILEEAERRGLLATEAEIQEMVDGAVMAYEIPEGKEMMDAYFQGAGITFEEYLAMLREQAPRQIARQKLLDVVGREYCEKNGLEFTKLNPPAELVAAQKAFIKDLFEQNKDKIVYYIDVP